MDVGYPPDPPPANPEAFKAFKKRYWTLNDGLHFNGPVRGLVIDGADLRTNDDAIALNADDGLPGNESEQDPFGPYVAQGPITDVVIRDIRLRDTAHGIRLLSRDQVIDRVSISNVQASVYSRFMIVSSFVTADQSAGKIGHISIDRVDLVPIAIPTLLGTILGSCNSFQCREEIARSKATPAMVRFYDEESESPVFSLNTSIGSLSLLNVKIRVSDSRPIVRVGAYANIGELKVDLTLEDPERASVPFLFSPGGKVDSVPASVRRR